MNRHRSSWKAWVFVLCIAASLVTVSFFLLPRGRPGVLIVHETTGSEFGSLERDSGQALTLAGPDEGYLAALVTSSENQMLNTLGIPSLYQDDNATPWIIVGIEPSNETFHALFTRSMSGTYSHVWLIAWSPIPIAQLDATIEQVRELQATKGPGGLRASDVTPYPRHVPIVVTSDADYAGLASGGSGTAIDPWIIDDFLIECNGTGSGVKIAGPVDDHVLFSNFYINESGSGALTDFGILLYLTVENVDFENGTIEDWDNRPIAVVGATNCTFQNVTCQTATGEGVYIDGSTDITFHDCVFQNVTNMNTAIFITDGLVGDCENITIDSCFFSNSSRLGWPRTSYGITSEDGSNLTITGNTFNMTDEAIKISDGTGVDIHGNTILGYPVPAWFVYTMNLINFNDSLVYNNVFAVGWDRQLYVEDCDNLTFTSNTLTTYDASAASLSLSGLTNSLIDNNTCYNITRFIDIADGVGVATENVTIRDNTLNCADSEYGFPRSPSRLFYLNGVDDVHVESNVINSAWLVDEDIVVDSSTDNITIHGNTIRDSNTTVLAITSNITVTGNYFIENITNYLTNDTTSNVTWEYNYYREYFDVYPYAITTSVIMDELEFTWAISVTRDDPHPMYFPAWFPRTETIYLNFFSNVDGLGIPFANLHVVLDGVPLTMTNPVIPHVLYHLYVSDFRGRLLFDEVLNLNDTGIYVDIGLDIAVQIHIRYYSVLDSFGFDFSLANLYIDGVRTPIDDPIMDHEIINFVVRDFANRILYNQTWNLTATGIFVDIGMNITTLKVQNNFNMSVIFHYRIAGVANSFPLAGGEIYEVRIALGIYSWWVTDDGGYPMEDIYGDDIVDTKNVAGPGTVSFGWVDVEPGEINNYTSSLLDYVLVLVILGVVIGIVVILGSRITPEKRKSEYNTDNRERPARKRSNTASGRSLSSQRPER